MFRRKSLYRLFSVLTAIALLAMMGFSSSAQDDFVTASDLALVQYNLDMTWMITAGFLVFFMQAGFAMLEGGFIRHTGVVNSLAENFMDACVTAIVFYATGFAIAYAGAGIFEAGLVPGISFGIGTTVVLDEVGLMAAMESGLDPYADFFFQFAFAGAAATIATGAMAERTDFRGKLIYSALLGAIIYPVVVFWSNWNGGWLGQLGMQDFAGSTIVHQTGGIIALIGAMMVGPRVGRKFGAPPAPSNLGLAALGTFILWFGWYGFNVGSTLAANDVHLMGLVATNTTLAAAAGSMAAMAFGKIRDGKWEMSLILNGSLAGLVGITAGCAYVTPFASIIIGLTSGLVMALSLQAVEASKIDDAVGAFSVHGACGALGTLAIGFWGVPELLGLENGGLFLGGGVSLLISQLIAVVAVTIWCVVTATIMFGALRAVGLLRISEGGEVIGIDAYEHGASLWPDVLPVPEDVK